MKDSLKGPMPNEQLKKLMAMRAKLQPQKDNVPHFDEGGEMPSFFGAAKAGTDIPNYPASSSDILSLLTPGNALPIDANTKLTPDQAMAKTQASSTTDEEMELAKLLNPTGTIPESKADVVPSSDVKDEDVGDQSDQPPAGTIADLLKKPGNISPSSPNTPTNASSPKDMLSSIFGGDLSDSAIKEAQAHRNDLEATSLMGRAGKEIAQGLSRGSYTPNYDIQNAQMQSAGQGIQDILQRRAGQMQQMQASLSLSDLQDKEQLRDASSPVSAAYRNMALQLNPKLSDDPNFQNMSGEAIKNTLPMVDMSIRAQAMQAQHEYNNILREQSLNYRQSQDQLKAGTEMPRTMATALNRGAGSIADQSNLAAEKIIDAFKLYPNLNDMPETIMATLRPEIAKLVSGGVGSEAMSEHILEPSFNAKLQNWWAKAKGAPTSAQMGEFLKANLPYIQAVQKTSADYVRSKLQPFAAAYKKRVDPDTYNSVMSGYSRYFPEATSDQALQQVAKGQTQASPPSAPTQPLAPNEVARKDANGVVHIFDKNTKAFIRNG